MPETNGEPGILLAHHLGITVTDLDRSIELFTEVLGYELINRAGRDPEMISRLTGIPGADIEVAYVRRPDSVVELLSYRSPANRGKIAGRNCDSGHTHLAFDVRDIQKTIETLRERGFTPLSEPVVNPSGPNGGATVVYLEDADRLMLELIERPQRSYPPARTFPDV